jgi:glycosyltransferase involved in cell wall biosynthesis
MSTPSPASLRPTEASLPQRERPAALHPVADSPHIAVVIPTYRASASILGVLSRIGDEVRSIIVVDDACPEQSGRLVLEKCADPRVQVLFNPVNLGVGGATVAGYRRALELQADVCVKLDSDGQMAPELIPALVSPILAGDADYAKGNRFYNVRDVAGMPLLRVVGNAGLSFVSKLSSGYWNTFDPTNGFTAIDDAALRNLDLDKLHRRFFFESDLLFRLHLAEAVVVDVPMSAHYGDEKSNLSETRALFTFGANHLRNLFKRIFYEYFLRDFNVASLQFALGLLLLTGGVIHGLVTWITNLAAGVATPAGTIGLVILLVIVGLMMLQGFLSFDYSRIPSRPLQRRFARLLRPLRQDSREQR